MFYSFWLNDWWLAVKQHLLCKIVQVFVDMETEKKTNAFWGVICWQLSRKRIIWFNSLICVSIRNGSLAKWTSCPRGSISSAQS